MSDLQPLVQSEVDASSRRAVPPAAQAGPVALRWRENTRNNEKKGQEFVGEVYKINCLPIKGLYMIHDFLTVEEEEALLTYLDSTDENVCPPWKASKFNGQCLSKGWGVKTVHGTHINKRIGHVRKNDVAAGEPDLPASFDWLLDRIHNLWRSFEVEMRGKDSTSTRSNIVQEMKSRGSRV